MFELAVALTAPNLNQKLLEKIPAAEVHLISADDQTFSAALRSQVAPEKRIGDLLEESFLAGAAVRPANGQFATGEVLELAAKPGPSGPVDPLPKAVDAPLFVVGAQVRCPEFFNLQGPVLQIVGIRDDAWIYVVNVGGGFVVEAPESFFVPVKDYNETE